MSTRIYNLLILALITLAAFCFVKAGYFGLEHYLAGEMSAGVTDRESIATKAGVKKAVKEQKRFDYKIILTRNLFGSSEKESKEEKVVKFDDNLKATDLDIILMGTIQGSKEAKRAIILDKKTHKQELYWVGDAIQGAQIKEIQRGKVILTFNGGYEVLDMSEASKMRKAYAPPSKPKLPKSLKRRLPGQGRRTGLPTAVAPMDAQEMGSPRAIKKTGGRKFVRPRVIRPSRRIVPRKD